MLKYASLSNVGLILYTKISVAGYLINFKCVYFCIEGAWKDIDGNFYWSPDFGLRKSFQQATEICQAYPGFDLGIYNTSLSYNVLWRHGQSK